jgi:fumarate hydratase subunit alpha
MMAKQALLLPIGERSQVPYVAQLETELLTQINKSRIGPAGLGGDTTLLDLHIKTFPTHIAGLPVAVNICCHVNRHVTRIL